MNEPTKVIDVELTDAISDMDNLEYCRGIHALVRLRGSPLGYVWVPTEGAHISAAALLTTIRWELGEAVLNGLRQSDLPTPATPELLQFEDLRSLPPRKPSIFTTKVTVAICTRNRTDELADCLDSVCAVNYGPLDILVIDNAPDTDQTLRLVRREYPTIRYVREDRPGLNWARNRAIGEAEGEVVAFADDDVVVDPNWISELVNGFGDDEDVMAVTGLVAPLELETQAQVAFERYGGFGSGFERRRYGSRDRQMNSSVRFQRVIEFSTGANMAFRKNVFDLIGRFDPALDVGTVTNGGGDIEMFFRLTKEDYGLVYQPSAIVRHRHRRSDEELLAQIESWGSGVIATLERTALAYPSERLACISIAREWFWNRFRELIRSTGSSRQHRSLVLAEIRGAVRGIGRYRRARRIAKRIESTFGPIEQR